MLHSISDVSKQIYRHRFLSDDKGTAHVQPNIGFHLTCFQFAGTVRIRPRDRVRMNSFRNIIRAFSTVLSMSDIRAICRTVIRYTCPVNVILRRNCYIRCIVSVSLLFFAHSDRIEFSFDSANSITTHLSNNQTIQTRSKWKETVNIFEQRNHQMHLKIFLKSPKYGRAFDTDSARWKIARDEHT